MTRTRRTMVTLRSPPRQWRNKSQSIYIMLCLATWSLDSPSPSFPRKTNFARIALEVVGCDKQTWKLLKIDWISFFLSAFFFTEMRWLGIFRGKKKIQKCLCLQHGVMRQYGICEENLGAGWEVLWEQQSVRSKPRNPEYKSTPTLLTNLMILCLSWIKIWLVKQSSNYQHSTHGALEYRNWSPVNLSLRIPFQSNRSSFNKNEIHKTLTLNIAMVIRGNIFVCHLQPSQSARTSTTT